MLKNKLTGILIDFDGVISKNSVTINLEFLHYFINKISPIPFETIKSYFKIANCFLQQPAVDLLFSSLGIKDHQELFLSELNSLKEFNNKKIKIEDDFDHFIKFCQKKNIRYKIFSLADKSKFSSIRSLTDNDIYQLTGKSKANISTYSSLQRELKIEIADWAMIDDNPLVLRAGNLSGLTTLLMKNDMYGINDHKDYEEFIDFKVNSFNEIQEILNK